MTETRSSTNAAAIGGLFAPVQHPILRSVDPKRVSEFLRESERYVGEVKKNRYRLCLLQVIKFQLTEVY